MKKILLLATVAASLFSFAQTKKTSNFVPYSPERLENAVIYEANIRQYSPEGTFKSFTKDIPKLKKLGIKIIWIMPIFPIGIEKRKEGLGSYYSIKDYTGINFEFGKLEDFEKLVQTAHENGIYIILDWVANHTAWDHSWVKEHPEYYTKDAAGKMISPFDWTDVVKLDYANKDMRKAMIQEMSYWVTKEKVDGFRCDVAMEVPKDFWEEATAQLRNTKPVFMLMEAEQPDLMEKAFDMQYGWEAHAIMNQIALGKKSVKDWDSYISGRNLKWKNDAITMNFTSNHDENSWNGTEYERMGAAVPTFAALTYLTPGMPLLYNGQEYDFNRRLKFFTKDEITKKEGKMMPLYEKLSALKNTNSALNGGKNSASYTRIATSSDLNILAFERSKDKNTVVFIANLTKGKQSFTVPVTGTYQDYISGKNIVMTEGRIVNFGPWEFKILIKKK